MPVRPINPTKRKEAWLANAPDAVILNMLRNFIGPEEPDESHPLAGQMYVVGCGYLTITAVRAQAILRGLEV